MHRSAMISTLLFDTLSTQCVQRELSGSQGLGVASNNWVDRVLMGVQRERSADSIRMRFARFGMSTEGMSAPTRIRIRREDYSVTRLSNAPKGNGVGATGSKKPGAYQNPCFSLIGMVLRTWVWF